ncbi:hypothetical protein OOZ15_05345 [Galbibacter sp. EGI 63066]|uniref:scabin-related ADP-ribosyltransferase n=1 Tax=Galbibacter sp. EGI 63066 TaxID=2993559 RepID=UPI0022488FE6|nr:enterotoxin A family protein [Galbibacter sp. EGI 63066]MCX2679361.1 hypothetical protein [Galbibacter sp. EGI 63066]
MISLIYSFSRTQGLATVSKVKVLDEDSPNSWTTTITGYDKKGRVIYTAEQNNYLNTTTINESDLDFTGKVLVSKTKHRKGTGTWIVTIDNYTYDHRGRLVDHYECIGEGSSFEGCDDTADYVNKSYSAPLSETTIKEASGSFTLQPGFHFVASSGKTLHLSIAQKGELIAHNVYDNLGQLKTKKVGNTENAPLQTVSYDYNIRGWLKKINNPSSLGTSLFGFEIKYNDIADTDKKLFNGNISQTLWNSKSVNPNPPDNPVSGQYTYTYDALNRITDAIDNTGNYNVSGIAYDQNGNITVLERKGALTQDPNSPTDFGAIDQLSYTYDTGNQLLGVSDQVTGVTSEVEFKDGNTGTDYAYDANGNMTQDLNKGIPTDGITYNHLNLPTSVTIGSGNISYIYDATGVKLKKTVSTGKVTEYAGNYVYENSSLKQITQPEGYIEPDGSGWQYVYRYVDIWGNTRLTYADDNGDGSVGTSEIRREQNYYPFGLEHKGYNIGMYGVKNNLKTYQGQEFTEDLGLNTHEWKYRVSDPAIGRFWQVDPLAEDYVYNSTYAFQENKLGMGTELEGKELKKWFNQAVDGLNRLFVEPVKNTNRRQAERAAVYGTPDRLGPTKNITGNYFGDAAYKLAGGETISKALAGDAKAQFRVIAGAEVALVPGGRGIGDDVATGATTKSTVKTSNFVFRGDTRNPSQIFEEGLTSKGVNFNLLDHATGLIDDSGFISTSTSSNIARKFAGKKGFVYTIEAPANGIGVNVKLGDQSPFPLESEIAFPLEIPSSNIQGARQVGSDGKFIGPYIKKP